MGQRTARTLSILSLLLAVAVCRAPAQKLPFKNYSTSDGLIHNEVRRLYQDSQGYLWIGTIEGMSRFDGATFTNYRLEDDRSFQLSTTFVNTFFEDREKNLWIGLNIDGGVGKFNLLDRSFMQYKVIQNKPSMSNWVNTLLQDAESTLWLGTDDGLFTIENGTFHRFEIDTTNAPESIRLLYEDRQGIVWIATQQGLYRRDNQAGVQLVQFPGLSITQCNVLYEDKNGNLWIGTNDIGLIKIENYSRQSQSPYQVKTYTLPDGLPSNSVHDILEDDFGTLWIATWAGLCKLMSGSQDFVTYTRANGLPSDNLLDILQDREGNLWLATTNGISKCTGETFINYGKNEGLPFEFLLQIIRAQDGALWFVGVGGAFYLMNGSFVPIAALEGQHVYSASIENNGIVWFGTTQGVVKWTDGKVLSRYTTANGLSGDRIHAVLRDSGGALWFGHERGASRLWQGEFQHFYGQKEYPLVVGITEDKDGTLWFATYHDGLYKFPAGLRSNNNWVKVDIPINHRTRAILCDKDNKIWIGTRLDGVFRYDPQTGALTRYTTADGLLSNFARPILQDSKGNLWFGTTRGVNRFDGTSFQKFSTRDGLAGDAVFACVEDEQGYLWFATSNGVTRYNPALERISAIPPPVYVTRLRIFGKEAPLENGIHLSASQHSVSFEYVGISFKDASQVRYQYRLNGLDSEWSAQTGRRYVNYTNLSPGDYVFEVQARNVDGVWSSQPATFTFHIATPVWQRWWFVTWVVVAVAGVVAGLYRYRVNRLLEMERVRSRIATDLHDEIGTSLSSMALFSDMARQEIQSTAPKVADKLKDISETGRHLMDSMRDIVWSINPDNDTLDDVVLYMKQFAAEVLEAKGIGLTFAAPDQTRTLRLPMDVRHHVYLIFKEAISNLVRHSDCSHADIHLSLTDKMLTLAVSDNGNGFDKSRPYKGNGLKNMSKRAQTINGTLTVESVSGRGTTIALHVPV